MAVYDSTRPYTVLNTDRTELHYFQVPRSALALPDGSIDAVAGLRIGPDNNALAAVVAPYFDSLGRTDVLDDPAVATRVVGPSIDLFRALITTHLADAPRAAAPLAGSLVLRVQEYVRAHLADRDLSAATIAAAHHVSVRHLYAAWERAGLGLHDTIRSLRLQECRRALRDPASAHLTVSGGRSALGVRRRVPLRARVPPRLRDDARRVARRALNGRAILRPPVRRHR